MLEVMPGMALVARAGRAFLAAAVHYLATEAGISQFLDIGTGLPTANNTHEVAQRANEHARIVYVDNDPIVLAHARALLTSGPDGETAYVDADIRDTDRILAEASRTLDFSQPVAVMLLAVLHFVPDADDPYKITARLVDAVPSGSYLALSHATGDIQSGAVTAGTERYNQRSVVSITPRSRAQVTRFFDGMAADRPRCGAARAVAPGPGPAVRLTRPAHLLRGGPQTLGPPGGRPGRPARPRVTGRRRPAGWGPRCGGPGTGSTRSGSACSSRT